MRALLTPYPQRDAHIVIFKPGSELMGLFGHQRVLISTVPEELKDFPIGKIPTVSQNLADDQRLHAFFGHEKVIRAAGGLWGLKEWLEGKPSCQWEKGNSGFHDKNLSVMDYDNSAVRLCWHHAHKFRETALPELDRLAACNLAEWVVKVAINALQLPQGHQLSFYELCWWALMNGVIDVMPDSAARHALRWKPAAAIKPVGKESDIVPEEPPAKVLVERTEPVKAVLYLAVDPETNESYMLRPKRRRWENAKYTQWVKRQPCCGCGNQADDPHHITGNGLGGMGTKPHDMFVIPLCRRCHDKLHANAPAWEEENGSQADLVLKIIDSALAMGVIATGKQK